MLQDFPVVRNLPLELIWTQFIRLFDQSYFLLPTLGSKFQMEIVLGMNGRIWIKTPEPKVTIAIARCIEAVDALSYDQEEVEAFLNTMDIS